MELEIYREVLLAGFLIALVLGVVSDLGNIDDVGSVSVPSGRRINGMAGMDQ